ncbi:hypothetical protein [Tunturibacter empetritectus]|uniref:Uncharacterized protein n=1 Tax=Tunturiibacter lichenicola TaxID=2051959 RepID=A0A7W8J5Z4_9BACT|nr:hypothetical protein [Edaphobacter lichenicola]MBB5343166.1 hypothetical protein [Edaphobacter lichenicola]
MSEPSTEQLAELETLRRVNAELLKTKHDLKGRIATLESEAATLESRTEKAEGLMRSAVIDVPMRRLAEGIAHVPALFIAELEKDYRVDVDADSGELRLLTKEDGKPVTDGKGEPVAMAHNALFRFLAGSPEQQKDDPRKKVFATLMRYSGASGGQGRKTVSSPSRSTVENESTQPLPSFGLR